MGTNYFKIKTGAKLSPLASSVSAKGDWGYNSATDKLELYNGGVDSFVTETGTATLTNKTIDGATNTLTGVITNANVSASAAIAYSKLALTGAIVLADIASAAYATAATASTLVYRDGSGNATFNTVTAALTGTASGNASYTPNQYGLLTSGSSGTMTVIPPDTSLTKILFSGGASAVPIWKIPFPINYMGNGDAEIDTAGWVTFADAASNLPVDGTGGSPSSTWTRTTSSPLRGAGSFLFTRSANNRQGEGSSFDFSIDSADTGRIIAVQCDYKLVSGAFVAADGITVASTDNTTTTTAGNSDLQFHIFDVTNSILIPLAPQVLTSTSTTGSTFKGLFQASTSTSYRLICYVARATAVAFTMQFDNFQIGPTQVSYAPRITDPVAYTPTITGFGTCTSVNFVSWCDGANLFISGSFIAGTNTGTEARISLGYNGTSGNVTTASTLPTLSLVGEFCGGTASTTYFGDNSVLAEASKTYLTLGMRSSTVNGLTKSLGSDFTNQSAGYVLFATVPIAGFSSGIVMSDDTDNRCVVAVANIIASNVSTTASTQINYTNIITDSHNCITTGVGAWKFTCRVPGVYLCSTSATNTSGTVANVYVYKNGVLYAGLCKASGNVASGAVPVKMIAGDYVDFRQSATATPQLYGTAPVGCSIISIIKSSGSGMIAQTETVNSRFYASATALTGSLATIVWTTKDYDSHNRMNLSVNGEYIVTTPGRYFAHASLATAGTFALNNLLNMQIQKNAVSYAEKKIYAAAAVTNLSISVSDIINCAAGDIIRVQVSSGATTPTIVSSNTQNFFSLVRLA